MSYILIVFRPEYGLGVIAVLASSVFWASYLPDVATYIGIAVGVLYLAVVGTLMWVSYKLRVKMLHGRKWRERMRVPALWDAATAQLEGEITPAQFREIQKGS